jgi:O-antigen/teichoic acid export membrane protein
MLAILDQGLISGSNFVIGIVLARWLIPEHYGAYALAFSIFLFLCNLEIALLLEPMSILGPACYRSCLSAYVGRVFELHLVLSCALSAPLAASAVLLHFVGNQAVARAMLGASIGTPVILLFWLCRRAAYLSLALRAAVSSAVVYCGSLVGFFLLTNLLGWLSPLVAFVIQSAAAVVAAVPMIASLKPGLGRASGPARAIVIRQHWQYGRWAVATVFVYWLSSNAYYVIVAGLLGLEDVAALRALQNFILPFGQFTAAISLLLLPWAAARFAQGDYFGFRVCIQQVSMLFVAVASAYVVGLWLFGEKLITSLYGGRYTGFAHLLPLVAAPIVVVAASHGISIGLQAMQSPAEVFRAHSLAGMVTVVTGVPLTRYWGLAGAAVGILASSLTLFVAIQHSYRSRLGVVSGKCVSRVDGGANEDLIALSGRCGERQSPGGHVCGTVPTAGGRPGA